MDDTSRIATVNTWEQDTLARENDLPVTKGGPSVTKIRYSYGNHLGSASLELDGVGGFVSYQEYFPFGGTFYTVGEIASAYRFTGKELDEFTGLYYFGARYYASWLGRWVSADPSGPVDGGNLYVYCSNRPIEDIPTQKALIYDKIDQGLLIYDKIDQGLLTTRFGNELPNRTVAMPNSRHFIKKVGKVNPNTKDLNTVIESWVDVAGDVKSINSGDALYDPKTNQFLVNGRIYGIKGSGRLIPVAGEGFHDMTSDQFRALDLINRLEDDAKSLEILETRIKVSECDIDYALKIRDL